jgi:molecular chaperone DnaK (HSP70)
VSVGKAKEIKERLSKVESFQKITRGEFESVWQSLAGSLTAPVDKALQDAGITLSEINHFELLGGQAAIPKIREQLSTYFGVSELTQKLDQFAMAKGAALYASNLTNPEEIRPLWLSEKLPGHVEATFQGVNITKTKTVFSEGSIAGQKKRIKIPSNFDLVAELKHFVDGKVAQHDIYNVTGIRDSAELYKEFKANMTNLLVFQIDASGFPQLV